MPRINSALFASKQKPGTRDKKKRQQVFDLDPDILTREKFRKVFDGVTSKKFTPVMHPQTAKDLIEQGLATAADFGFDDNFDTSFNPEDL